MNRKSFWIYNCLTLLLYATGSLATEKSATPHKTKPPLKMQAASSITQKNAPPIHITKKKKHRIEEYRLNGAVVMIKVTPKKGAPYFLIDSNGDGTLNKRAPDFTPELLIPNWTLFRW